MRILLISFLVMNAISTFAIADISKEEALKKSKIMVKQLATELQTNLKEAVKEGGFDTAISACNATAVLDAQEIGKKHGASIRRVSLKLRNQDNAPDGYEQVIMAQMEADMAQGKLKPAYVGVSNGSDGKQELRFMKPIVTKALCLNCHGAPDKLNPKAAKMIEFHYPEDKATGYEENQVRGAFSVIYPLN